LFEVEGGALGGCPARQAEDCLQRPQMRSPAHALSNSSWHLRQRRRFCSCRCVGPANGSSVSILMPTEIIW